ncbi:uncharacterized protein L969DRAFT_20591 [Mixia osmundae IAM 14324]|uniref:DNA sliding clamp PCNA n=1 Tax=Mixia osmundae (strain CBS 9802 / IAM 14324 / JCM 22182 / KY 12970) TaxID=764103 RepID=G7DS03_MIXOS|nr:uncharacterized protein L969DRAFT_20591 [Mixia osmundae IAM 14324]KEI36152.1 hypothetical protein L969DRAFT_20591 [Mixia osmundae IAM 14324]GAA93363.1 hypothetical protein E5Q_00003 [Mixia osmundae IAM 14324]
MLEARLKTADLLKKILDAIKELVTDANFECTDEGIKLQAMDNSHVALVSLELETGAFEDDYRCDRNLSLGINLASLTKIVKCAGNDDQVTLRATDDGDVVNLSFQDPKTDRIGEYELKLMDIDQEQLGIPTTEYDAEISMPSHEFRRIINDLSGIGESVKIEATKENVKFFSDGDIGKASVTLKPTGGSAISNGRKPSAKIAPKKKKNIARDDDEEMEDEEDVKPTIKKEAAPIAVSGDEDDEEVSKPKKKGKKVVQSDSDGEDGGAGEDDEEQEQPEESEEEEETSKKRKRAGKETKKGKPSKDDGSNNSVTITLNQSVSLFFTTKYLANFSKAATLSNQVQLKMSNEIPLLVEFGFEGGKISYYLAPKISDDDT